MALAHVFISPLYYIFRLNLSSRPKVSLAQHPFSDHRLEGIVARNLHADGLVRWADRSHSRVYAVHLCKFSLIVFRFETHGA